MGTFLTEDEISRLKVYLTLYFSLPFSSDLSGETYEQILAKARRGKWQGKRDNRPNPDVVINNVNYSVKTEKIPGKLHAHELLGKSEDIITARPDPSEELDGKDFMTISDDELGTLILLHYNLKIVRAYNWDKIAILFRLQNNKEFVYFEEPAIEYPPDAYHWKPTGRAKGENRNIAGYDIHGNQKFRWTSRGKQFYVIHNIPHNADIFSINPVKIGITELINKLAN